MATVVVSGGSGFVAAHAIAQLLTDGHHVRTTLRSLDRQPEVEQMLAIAGAPHPERVAYFSANLRSDEGWAEALAGADYVLHVASPFPSRQPKDPDELVVPARDGALRVLRAARDLGVRRVVLTSSFAAVGYGHEYGQHVFDESDWTDPDAPGITPYAKSKTVAERAAWDFIERKGGSLELAVVNPVGILGPVLGPDLSSSVRIVSTLLSGQLPAAPPMWMNVVDVRDVADLHVRAMTNPDAAGRRFLAVAGQPISFHEIALALRRALGAAASRVTTRTAPAWVFKALAAVVPPVREISPQLNVIRAASNARARSLLQWEPRSNEEAAIACAESLLRLGIVRDRRA